MHLTKAVKTNTELPKVIYSNIHIYSNIVSWSGLWQAGIQTQGAEEKSVCLSRYFFFKENTILCPERKGLVFQSRNRDTFFSN